MQDPKTSDAYTFGNMSALYRSANFRDNCRNVSEIMLFVSDVFFSKLLTRFHVSSFINAIFVCDCQINIFTAIHVRSQEHDREHTFVRLNYGLHRNPTAGCAQISSGFAHFVCQGIFKTLQLLTQDRDQSFTPYRAWGSLRPFPILAFIRWDVENLKESWQMQLFRRAFSKGPCIRKSCFIARAI